MKKDTLLLALRAGCAFVAIVVVLSVAQKWDDADSARISAQMRAN